MSDVTIHGIGASTYVRSAVMTCIEKGLSYALEAVELGSDAHRALHPWGKMPAIQHDGLTLYETSAICRYLDNVSGGDSLQPADPRTRAVMDQWIGVMDSYLYPDAIRGYVLPYIFPSGEGGQPDRATIDAGVPKIKSDLAVLDAAYGESDFLAGDSLTLADILVAPVIGYLGMFPESKELLAGASNVSRAHAAIAGRESFKTAISLGAG